MAVAHEEAQRLPGQAGKHGHLRHAGGEKEIREYHTEELKFKPKKRRNTEKVDAELKALEALEKKETGSRID